MPQMDKKVSVRTLKVNFKTLLLGFPDTFDVIYHAQFLKSVLH
jgi:hypothetical protein